MEGEKRIPVTVITGFLGSGKTTLLKNLLQEKHGKRIAVIENEFASSIGISNELHGTENNAVCVAQVFETGGGCICCGSKDEFVATLYELVRSRDKIDYIIIETTGRADPAFVQVFMLDPNFKKYLYVDGIIALVDAHNIMIHLESEHKKWKDSIHILNEAVEQIAAADRVIINKVDLSTEEEIMRIEEKVKSINPYASILRSQFCKLDASDVLDLKAFDIERVLKQDEGFLEMRPFRQHDAEVQVMEFEGTGAVDMDQLNSWLSSVFLDPKLILFRAKGVLNIYGKEEKYVLQMVHSKWSITAASKWEKSERTSKLVFIGKRLDKSLIMNTFPPTMKLQAFDQYSPARRSIPKSQFVMMIVALVFFKGGEIIQYLRAHQTVAVLVFIMFAFMTMKLLRK